MRFVGERRTMTGAGWVIVLLEKKECHVDKYPSYQALHESQRNDVGANATISFLVNRLAG